MKTASFSKAARLMALLMAFAIAFVSTPAEAAGHPKTFGVNMGYNSYNESAEAGLFFQYGFSRYFRLSADAQVVFRNKHRDAFIFDLNAHVPVVSKGGFELYPFAGVNYSSWSTHFTVEEDDREISASSRHGSFGINAGLGFGYKISSTLKLKLEVGYTGVKERSACRALLGIGFCF